MNTSILMRHSEIWVNELQNESYKIDGIVVGDSISYLIHVSETSTKQYAH